MTEERWTEQTETLVARAWCDDYYDNGHTPDDEDEHQAARAVLAALADAGLLVAPGGDAVEAAKPCSTAERESYVRGDSRVWWERGECILPDGHDGDHQTSTGTRWKWVPGGGLACDSMAARAGGHWRREVEP